VVADGIARCICFPCLIEEVCLIYSAKSITIRNMHLTNPARRWTPYIHIIHTTVSSNKPRNVELMQKKVMRQNSCRKKTTILGECRGTLTPKLSLFKTVFLDKCHLGSVAERNLIDIIVRAIGPNQCRPLHWRISLIRTSFLHPRMFYGQCCHLLAR
jgi:hypothetical protein